MRKERVGYGKVAYVAYWPWTEEIDVLWCFNFLSFFLCCVFFNRRCPLEQATGKSSKLLAAFPLFELFFVFKSMHYLYFDTAHDPVHCLFRPNMNISGDLKPQSNEFKTHSVIQSASPVNGRWIAALILMAECLSMPNILTPRCFLH
jgi:hypothetical protein